MNDLCHRGNVFPSFIVALESRRTRQSEDTPLDRLPIGIYTCDRDGVVIQFNKRAAELWGRSPECDELDTRFCGSHRLFRLDGRPLPHAETPMAEALRTARPVRDQTVVVERPDSTRITVLVNIDPLFNDDGTFVGAVNCFQDISELKRVEAKLNESERRLRDCLEALPAAVYMTDPAGRLTFYNQAAHLLQSGRGKALGSPAGAGFGDVVRLMAPVLAGRPADGTRGMPDGGCHQDGSADLRDGSRLLHLDWQEWGDPTVRQPVQQGFGTRFVERGVTQQLQGSVTTDFDPSGVRCAICIPLPGTQREGQ